MSGDGENNATGRSHGAYFVGQPLHRVGVRNAQTSGTSSIPRNLTCSIQPTVMYHRATAVWNPDGTASDCFPDAQPGKRGTLGQQFIEQRAFGALMRT